ncbi:MAG: hypothetical protein WKG06_04565 [Segetibacter sp.]
MKKILMFSLIVTTLFITLKSFAQEDKSKRPSPPAKVSATTSGWQYYYNRLQPSPALKAEQ